MLRAMLFLGAVALAVPAAAQDIGPPPPQAGGMSPEMSCVYDHLSAKDLELIERTAHDHSLSVEPVDKAIDAAADACSTIYSWTPRQREAGGSLGLVMAGLMVARDTLGDEATADKVGAAVQKMAVVDIYHISFVGAPRDGPDQAALDHLAASLSDSGVPASAQTPNVIDYAQAVATVAVVSSGWKGGKAPVN